MSFIVQYLRNKSNRKCGVMYAEAVGPNRDHLRVGVSACNPRDKFNQEVGMETAKRRSVLWESDRETPELGWWTDAVQAQLKVFMHRCDKYFKGCSRPEWLQEQSDELQGLAGVLQEGPNGIDRYIE